MLGGIHGDNEIGVFKELCEVVEEWIEIYETDGTPLPIPKGVAMFEAAV